ncbi:hypothetical protein BGZ81_005675 [Podila clonocystis]|nr:hypothetical protein BGZ81_005675 [Podila clonocystis]
MNSNHTTPYQRARPMQATKFAHSSTVIYGSENGPREVEHPCRAIFRVCLRALTAPSPTISYWISHLSYKDTTTAAKAAGLRWKRLESENRNVDHLSQPSAPVVAPTTALGTPASAGTRE